MNILNIDCIESKQILSILNIVWKVWTDSEHWLNIVWKVWTLSEQSLDILTKYHVIFHLLITF